jgi:hypothetical protein
VYSKELEHPDSDYDDDGAVAIKDVTNFTISEFRTIWRNEQNTVMRKWNVGRGHKALLSISCQQEISNQRSSYIVTSNENC